MPFYAVARGKTPGVYLTWPECQTQTVGFKGPIFKKFGTKEEAETFVQERAGKIVDKRKTSGVQEDSTENSSSCDSSSKRKNEDDSSQTEKKTKLIELKRYGSTEFTVDSDDFVVVYTDGACSFNGRHGAQAGIGVYFGPDHSMNVSDPVEGRATNNTAEIQAATRAVLLAKNSGVEKLKINTDSNFMINCMTSWLSGWKKRGWKKADGKEVINKEDLMQLDEATVGLMVKWNHVNGHSGNIGNDAADKLARDGAKKYVASATKDES